MTVKTKRISTLIESQLPEFISSEYEMFSKFVQKYYESQEVQGAPLDVITNIQKYMDIDYYEKNLLKQNDELALSLTSTDTSITLVDGSSFPEKNGYVRIGEEIIFYASRSGNELLECSRGVSGNTKLGDLYNESNFVTTVASTHSLGEKVYNISNLFLYAIVRNFESQYLGSFPEKYLKEDVDKRTLIKNIQKFYKAKGTESSIKFVFNSLIAKEEDNVPSTYNPRDYTLKSSISDWVTSYSLKVKVVSGNASSLIGNKIIQDDKNYPYASAIVDDVRPIGGADGEQIYEVILNPQSVNGEFRISSRTELEEEISTSLTAGDRVTVQSTVGWKKEGSFIVGNETFTFKEKNVKQFYVDTRSSSVTHNVGDAVYDFSPVKYNNVVLMVFGTLYDLKPSISLPYAAKGDSVQITNSGFNTRDRVIFNASDETIRWYLNDLNTAPSSSSNLSLQTQIEDFIADVSAIYEDEQFYYICSSSYPSYDILSVTDNETLLDPKVLRIIRKNPIQTTEIYETSNRDVGIFVDGTLAFSHKDSDLVKYGYITKTNITAKGSGYKKSPFVLINNQPNKAVSVLSGETVNSISIINNEIYTDDPEVTITSGRNATAKAIVTKGEITSIVVENPGEYYSSPPIVRITDSNGKGNFAEYESVVSEDGQVTEFIQINKGRLYGKNTVSVDIIAQGSGSTATAEIRKWVKNRYKKLENSLDDANGYVFDTYNPSTGKHYGIVANPLKLRAKIGDNLNNLLQEPATKVHSKILGYAFDGNPIYGPFGYSDPGDPTSSIARMQSGYTIKTSRENGPSIATYPLGTFIDDYTWTKNITTGKTRLDENNGRYCVTPEYPEGTYAYFISTNSLNNPTFPYILGENFYSLPVSSNYSSDISQNDLPRNSLRLNVSGIDSNGYNAVATIQSVKKGSVTSAVVEDSVGNFSVDNELNLNSLVLVDDSNTGGQGAAASVSEIFGRNVESVESVEVKPTKISTRNFVYFFDGDIITQDNTGATGEVVGDSFNTTEIVLRSVTNTFNSTDTISSDKTIINVTIDKESSYVKGSVLSLYDGVDSTIATGEVLESTNDQNIVKLKVLTGSFIVDDSYSLLSDNLIDTSGSKIIVISSLSKNINVLSSSSNIVLVKTEDAHRLSINDIINVEIDPDDSVTETTYYVRKRKYQKLKLAKQNYFSTIQDTGIGRIDTLIGGFDYASSTFGGGTFTDVEVLFSNVDDARNNLGQTVGDVDSAVIGRSGGSDNARATVTIGYIVNVTSSNSATNTIVVDDTTHVFPGIRVRGQNISNDTSVLSVDRDTNTITLTNNQTNFPITGALTTVVFNPGVVSTVTITSKGTNYRKGDTISFADSDLDKGNFPNARDYLAIVDHIGLSTTDNILSLVNVRGLSENDLLRIGQETVKVLSVDITNNKVVVERGQNNTLITDHYNGTTCELIESEYRFTPGTQLFDQDPGDPFVKSYDKDTQVLTLYYEYGETSIRNINLNTLFTDQSSPAKTASVSELIALYNKFEYSKSNTNFEILTTLDLQKNYSYKFDTSHSSMANTFLEFSPSINRNIIAVDSFRSNFAPGANGSYITLKPGQTFSYFYGSTPIGNAIDGNALVKDESLVEYTRYYFFDKNNDVDVSDSYFNIINDPLQGRKKIVFTTENSFVYDYTTTPQYDGSGTIKYSTTNRFAVGRIKSVKIDSPGDGYENVPSIFGVAPSRELEATVDVQYNPVSKNITGLTLLQKGKNYVNPKAVVIGDGSGAIIDVFVKDGEIVSVFLKNGGRYNSAPSIKIVETSVKIYFQSDNIGVPESVKIENSGFLYHTDDTLSRKYLSTTALTLFNVDEDAFTEGEKVVSESNGVVYATGIVAKNGWKKGSNIIRLRNVTGSFIKGLSVQSEFRKKPAEIIDIFTSEFSPNVKTYYDNIGYYKSDKGKIGSNSQKITDSYFYQDFSYVIRSKTPISVWRNLIKETTHPAGFQLFGELVIESFGKNDVKSANLKNFSIINLAPKQVSNLSTSKFIKQSIVNYNHVNEERGLGSVSVDSQNNTETYATEISISPAFDGVTKTFTIQDKNTNNPLTPYNEEELLITLDGVVQEPKVAYTVSGTNITFADAPLGERTAEGQNVPPQTFYGRAFKFKIDTLNEEYLRKVRNFFQRNGRWLDAANQIKFNRQFIVEESIGYVTEKYPNIAWNQFREKCSRDIGYFIDAIEHDIRFGGNFKSISAAESYYNNNTVDHITDQITESLDAFKYAAKLCAAAIRNWDYTVTNAVIAPNNETDIIQVDSTFGIVIGMNISSGSQYAEGTTVTEIVNDTQVRVSNNSFISNIANSLDVQPGQTVIILLNEVYAGVQIQDTGIIEVGDVNVAQVGAATLTSVTSFFTIPQVTFSLSKINNGTFYDASNLIEKNKLYIQEETLGYIKAQYPLLVIPDETKCKRDTGYLVDAVVYSLRYGGTEKIIEFAKSYYNGNTLKFINNELTESVEAFEYAVSLMVLAMRTLLPNGTYTSEIPFTGQNILSDPEPFLASCIEVESSLDSYSNIVKTLLLNGIGLVQPEPENSQRSGNWTNRKTYSNYDIIADSKLISYPDYNDSIGSKECDDVVDSISSLYGGLESVLLNGVNSVIKTNVDYIDGETKEFELYYEDSSIVKTDENENLLVFLNGVLQLPKSYNIVRSSDENEPDIISFTEAPKWEQNLNSITTQEPIAIDKTFITRVGSYESLTIDNERVSIKKTGPFLIFDSKTNIPRKIDDTRYAYVFVDGVLQNASKSYIISGATITFKKPLSYHILDDGTQISPRVDILLFYGRDIEKKLTFYDFEPETYYNKVNFSITDSSVGATEYNKIVQYFQLFAPSNYNLSKVVNGTTLLELNTTTGELNIIGHIKKVFFDQNLNKVDFVLASNNIVVGNEFGILDPNGTHILSYDGSLNNPNNVSYQLSNEVTADFTYDLDAETGLRRLPRTASPFAYDTAHAKKEWDLKPSMIPNLKEGDKIKIDGESDFREITSIPDTVFSKDFRPGTIVHNEIYAKVSATNYNGFTKGIGLGIVAELSNGSVSNLVWNKRDYNLYTEFGIVDKSTVYGYMYPPEIEFIPVDNNGGGAKAEAIVLNGMVVDIVLTNPGSGYTQPPKVVISRGYFRDKDHRKIDYYISFSKIPTETNVKSSNFVTSTITAIVGGYQPDGVVLYASVSSPAELNNEFVGINQITIENELDVSVSHEIVSKIDVSAKEISMSSTTFSTAVNVVEVDVKLVEVSIDKTIINFTRLLGSIDKAFNEYPDFYNQDILGNSLRTFEGFKFVETGYSDVSLLTIEDYSNLYPDLTIGDFDEPGTVRVNTTLDLRFNSAYPSIQNFASYLDIAVNATDNTIYVPDTSRFAASGKLLLGDEIIEYTSKLTDRFIGVTRGVDGTTAKPHDAGDLIRTF